MVVATTFAADAIAAIDFAAVFVHAADIIVYSPSSVHPMIRSPSESTMTGKRQLVD